MKILRATIFALGLLMVVSGAKAQTTRVVGNVPFSFVVGEQVLPAGEYSLSSLDGSSGALVVRNDNLSDSRIALTHSKEKIQPAEKTVLVFHRIGDQYFLAEVWSAGRTTGRVLPQSSLETRMARDYSSKDNVLVAAVLTR